MDKNALKDFAMKSRENLTRMMRAKLENLHIEDELTFKQHGNIWENEQHRLSAMTDSEYKRYESLKSAVKRDGLKSVIERAAYTWFNRIVAIRYMEVNDFLPLGKNFESLGINVLCDKSGDFRNPEILTISKLRSTDLKIDYDRISGLNDQDKYKDILLAIVMKLGEAIPDVFDGDTENIDALVPDGLLMPNGLIDNILRLGSEQFKQTEIIGWLYQYYNQAEKDRAMKLKTPTTKEDVPYVTQIFTPNWVVKYLVENSLGRYWLDRHPNKDLEQKWKFLICKDCNTLVINDSKTVEDITFIDPCSGSGHILIYAFEVFYQIYESEGYPKSDIPQLILNKNLYGLDIDDRANQLSILACMLIARKYDNKLFTRPIKRHILSIRESNKLELATFSPKGEAEDILKYITDVFYDAKEYGSILKVKNYNYGTLRESIKDDQIAMVFGVDKTIEPLIAQAEILSSKFSVVVTNPPYMDKYNDKLKKYIQAYYPEEKSNLAVVFIDTCSNLTDEDGMAALITIESWMFLTKTYLFREKLLNNAKISSMLHLGSGAFEGMGGAVLSTTAFVLDLKRTQNGIFYRLVDGDAQGKQKRFEKNLEYPQKGVVFSVDSDSFKSLPDDIIAYWMSDGMRRIFSIAEPIDKYGSPRQGLATTDNDRFTRLWWEPAFSSEKLDAKNYFEAVNTNAKWFPYNKGGRFRKWFGNNDYVVNWQYDGREIKEAVIAKYPYLKGNYGFVVKNPQCYFKPSITWSKVSGNLGFRYKEPGCIFDVAGCSIFAESQDELTFLQGLLNSNVLDKISKFISPTINIEAGQVATYPIIVPTDSVKNEIISIVEDCREISKDDWDNYEVSWGFTIHPLLRYRTESNKLSDVFSAYKKYCDDRFARLKSNEEKINDIVIKLYGLENELSSSIPDDRITIRKANHAREAKSFLSYFIGCVMGRYDYSKNGIQYAGPGTEMPKNNIVDEDGIITILDKEFSGKDDVINKLRKFLTESLGEKTLLENMDWIADGLGRKDTERSEDVIRKYFVEDFFNNHAHMIYADPTKRSDGRPIYWEISSGKHNAFKALFYIHRYTPNLIAKVRMDYSTPILRTYERRRAEIETQLKTTIADSEYNRLYNELADLQNKIEELTDFDRILKNVADQKIELDLDDGVKVNYPKLSLAASGVKKNVQILEAIK